MQIFHSKWYNQWHVSLSYNQKYSISCCAYIRETKRRCRNIFRKILRNFFKPEIDLIASSSNTQLLNFIHGKSFNAFHMFWESLHFTTSHLIAKVLVEQEQTQCKSGTRANTLNNTNSSLLKDPTMIFLTSETSCGNIFAPTQKSETSTHRQNKKRFAQCGWTLTDSVSPIRESLHQCNFSENVEELILQSWRVSIQVKYKAYLERWYRLCTEESINPFNPLWPLDLIWNSILKRMEETLEQWVSNARSALSRITYTDNTPFG